jgi:hypothetical protein
MTPAGVHGLNAVPNALYLAAFELNCLARPMRAILQFPHPIWQESILQ